MAITVDWPVKIINVPKADMTLIQSSPIEVRELNLDTFRLTLKNLEDDAEGMVFIDTHRHNPPVDVGGIILARVVEIINGYTVTFEDGAYVVNMVGANSNVLDRVNPNNVSVRSANSAGLMQSREIEQAAFEGMVHIDVAAGAAGTLYPLGTDQNPVNNLADAKLIAETRGINTIHVHGTLVIGGDVSGYNITGDGAIVGLIETYFSDVYIQGQLGGVANFRDCFVGPLTQVRGVFHDSGILGPITPVTPDGVDLVAFDHCYSTLPLVVDLADTDASVSFTEWQGQIEFINGTGAGVVYVGAIIGTITIASSCTSGLYSMSGNQIVINNSTGTAVVDTNAILTRRGDRLLSVAKFLGLK